MSLVNDMLRDLDQRSQSPKDSAVMPMTPVQGQATAPARWLPALLLAALVAISVLGLWLYNRNVAMPAGDQAIVDQAVPTPVVTTLTGTQSSQLSPEQLSQQPSPALPVQTEIEQQQWRINGRYLQLRLGLNQAPLRRVEVSTGQQFTLILGPVVLAPSLNQQLPKPPSQIGSAEWLNGEEGLTLKLSTTQAARFSVVGGDQAEGHQLLVKIELLPQQAKRLATPDTADNAVMPAAPIAVKKSETAAVTVAPQAKRSAQADRTPRAKPVAAAQKKEAELQTSQSVDAQIKGQPDSHTATASDQSLNKMVQQTPQQQDRGMAVKMTRLVNARQLTQAQQQLRSYIAVHPVASESRTLLATLQIGSQQTVQAQQLIDKGLELDPYHPGLRKLKARLLIQNSQLSQAIELLNPQLPAVAADPEYHQILAAAQQAAGQHQQAAAIYHRLLSLRSDEPAWWIGLALSLESMQQTRQAREAYQNVLRIPGLSRALSDYAGQRLSRLGG
ncbi:MAG: tetratricopeptide repeat protein [Motiliproteus sp.]